MSIKISPILITHDLGIVARVADRVNVMYCGELVESGEALQIFDNPLHPYTRALLASVLTPEPGLGLPETHLGIVYPNPIDPPRVAPSIPAAPKRPKSAGRSRPNPSVKTATSWSVITRETEKPAFSITMKSAVADFLERSFAA